MKKQSENRIYTINNKNNLIERRIRAAILDQILNTLFYFVFLIFILSSKEEYSSVEFVFIVLIAYFLVVLFEIIIFKGSSLGKKKYRLKIIFKNNKNNFFFLYLRRLITYTMYQVIAFSLFTNNETITDILFKTEVVSIED